MWIISCLGCLGNCKSVSVVSSPLLFLSTKLQSGFLGKEENLFCHFQQHADSQLEPSVFVLIASSSCLNIFYLYITSARAGTSLSAFLKCSFYLVTTELFLMEPGPVMPRACRQLVQRLCLPGKVSDLISSAAASPEQGLPLVSAFPG